MFVAKFGGDNANVIRGVLSIFENLSGLAVNFDKCGLCGFHLDEAELEGLVEFFGCRKQDLPLDYLGMKIGGGLGRLGSWEGLIERTRRRLNGWKASSVSMGGRVTLINSVLASIPSYRMAFASIPVGVVKKIRGLQRKFLWGEEEGGSRKISWVKWVDVCKSKFAGGLGVKNLEWFNAAMLGKWVWRMLVEGNSLWARLVKSRHGVEVRRMVRGSAGDSVPRGGGWWSGVLKAVSGKTGDWFWPRLERRIGNGMGTLFWTDRWGDSLDLKSRFPRLFHLSVQKERKIGEIGSWSNNTWSWKLQWRRPLSGRDTEAAVMLEAWLANVVLEREKMDCWKWGDGEARVYSVKKAYIVIEETVGATRQQQIADLDIKMYRTLWKAAAPQKQKVVCWRALRNRLPTRENLVARNVIQGDVSSCLLCQAAPESVEHFLLRCEPTAKIWDAIFRWLEVSWVAPRDLPSHFVCFSNLLGGKRRRYILGAIWVCIVWVVWRWRNMTLFENQGWDVRKIVDEIKSRLWSWFAASKVPGTFVNFGAWLNGRLTDYWTSL